MWWKCELLYHLVFFFFTITTFCLGNPCSKRSGPAPRQIQQTRCPRPPQESACLWGRFLAHCPSNSTWNRCWAHVVATCETALHAHTLGVNLLFSSLFASLLSFTLLSTKGFKHNTAFQKSDPSWPGIWKIYTSSIHWLYVHGKRTDSQKGQICHWLP